MTAFQNLVAAFNSTVQKKPEDTAIRFYEDKSWQTLSWQDLQSAIQRVAGGLKRLGVQKGDRVAIFSRTRYEWTIVDLGILAVGGVVVPIYESSTDDQAAYILENAEVKVLFVENKELFSRIEKEKDNIASLQQIVSFEELPQKAEGIYSLNELKILGVESGQEIYEAALKQIAPDDIASLVYTSGTTGNPKGAVLTHHNFMCEVEACIDVFPHREGYESLIFLPLAHILARVVQYFHLRLGFVQAYAESIDRLLENIATIRPHFMASVPRIFEKIHTRTMQNAENAKPAQRKIFDWAVAVGRERSRLVLNHQKIPFYLQAKCNLADKLVFQKLHKKLGGRLEFFISGGAPLSEEVGGFFHAFGFTILEGYGLTETTAAVSINRMEATKIGTVGLPLKGCEIKIAGDGEILVRGDMVFQGYFKNQEATDAVMNSEGWFHTGDIGQIDEEGFIKITDRKKDIIVTAGGKNIAPQNIENLMKTDPFISQFVVHGDKRKFLSALVTLDQDEIMRYAKDHKIAFNDYPDLIRQEKIFTFVKQRIEEKNKELAKYETIKRFQILPTDFSVESGELTPTLKVKRKVITNRYKKIFDSFYNE
ncbi:MAG: long-chain fatty acid--CoA ligase [Deltaproteobacteria bacterium]|nr:long-chain fatty acid--CoA ligase [Deltaproteobacteria bacterium]